MLLVPPVQHERDRALEERGRGLVPLTGATPIPVNSTHSVTGHVGVDRSMTTTPADNGISQRKPSSHIIDGSQCFYLDHVSFVLIC